MLVVHLAWVAGVTAIVYLLYRQVTTYRGAPHGLKALPGPKGYPVIGSILEFPRTFSYHKFTEWAQTYGPIYQVNIAGTTHIVISDVEIASDLMALRGAQYSDRPSLVMLHELVSRTGNLGASPQNKYWKNARKLAAARLADSPLEAWNTVQVDEARRLVDDLLKDTSRYEYLFERYSSLVMLRMLYDKKTSDTKDEENHVRTITAIVRTLERTAAPGAYLVDMLPFLKYLPEFLAPFKTEAKMLHNFEYSFFRGLVDDANRRYVPLDKNQHDQSRPRALVHGYMDNQANYDLSQFDLAYCAGTLFEGGSGTTSSALQTFCLAMWHYPDWQKKIQQEIDAVIGDRLPSFDDSPRLPTVRAAIKETLRWRPIVPGGIPHVSTSADSYRGYYIPPGAVLHGNQYAMFKDESIYPDAESFNPGRWLEPKYATTYQEPLTQYPNLKRFAAFGFGRRICPGLAAAERSLFIEVTMLMWVCSVGKKLDAQGKVVPVHWYDYRPGNNTGPMPFEFTLEARSAGRVKLLRGDGVK